MTTANKLTLCRVVMIPIFLVLLYVDFTGHLWAALAVFILASVTDFIDGYVARHYHQITDFGKFMDPLADKQIRQREDSLHHGAHHPHADLPQRHPAPGVRGGDPGDHHLLRHRVFREEQGRAGQGHHVRERRWRCASPGPGHGGGPGGAEQVSSPGGPV